MSFAAIFDECKLYHYWRSSSSWRVRWALNLKGITPQFVHVNLLDDETEKQEHLNRNPLGFVPVLELKSGKKLIESVAIIEMLEEFFPTPALFPGDVWNKQHIRTLVEYINAGIQPVQNLTVMEAYSSDANKRKEWGKFFTRRGLKAYEALVQKSAGRFSCGNEITAADLYLIPQCYNALRFEIDLQKEFPTIYRIHTEALKTSACKASAPETFEPK